MEIIGRELQFTFRNKTLAEEFLKNLRQKAFMYDIVVVNDILRDRGQRTIPEGFHYGYDRKTIRKLKAEKEGSFWFVKFPEPGKMVRDMHGHWTTEKTDISETTEA